MAKACPGARAQEIAATIFYKQAAKGGCHRPPMEASTDAVTCWLWLTPLDCFTELYSPRHWNV